MTPVEFHFITPTGVPIVNAAIEIQISQAGYDAITPGIMMPRLLTVTSDAFGKAMITLVSSDIMYFVTATDSASEAALFYKFIVPPLASGVPFVRLQDILVEGPLPQVPYDQAALLTILTAKANAMSASTTAQAEVAAAATSAASALASQIAAAAGSATSATNSATTATTAAGNANTSATAAATSATAASGSSTTAATQATSATINAALTAADRVQTGLDRVATAADRVQTGLDRTATTADRVQTGLDKTATAADRVVTTADRTQTGLDKIATAADRVQTGLDRTAASTSAGTATTGATTATTKAGEASASATAAAASAVLAASTVTGVSTFNTRSGGITLTGADVTTALGITPINAAGAPVQTVAGRAGAVVLAKGDVGLGNVDNTADSAKPVSTAQATADTAVQTAAASDATTKANAAQAAAIAASAPSTHPGSGGGSHANVVAAGASGFMTGTDKTKLDAVTGTNTGDGAVNALYSGLAAAKQDVTAKDATGGYAGLTLFKLNLRNVANTITSWFTNANTVARTYTLKDADGTIAFTSDITGTNSGTNTGDETGVRVATLNHAAALKSALVDADETTGQDSAASFGLIRTTWGSVKTYLKTYFDTLYSTLAGNTFTGAQIYSDQLNTRAMFKDCALAFLDKGNSGVAAQTCDYTAGSHQKLTVTGAFVMNAVTNWPPTGNTGELLLELVNGASSAITWTMAGTTQKWWKADGTSVSSIGSSGVTLQAAGTDWILMWSTDAGTTTNFKVMR